MKDFSIIFVAGGPMERTMPSEKTKILILKGCITLKTGINTKTKLIQGLTPGEAILINVALDLGGFYDRIGMMWEN